MIGKQSRCRMLPLAATPKRLLYLTYYLDVPPHLHYCYNNNNNNYTIYYHQPINYFKSLLIGLHHNNNTTVLSSQVYEEIKKSCCYAFILEHGGGLVLYSSWLLKVGSYTEKSKATLRIHTRARRRSSSIII